MTKPITAAAAMILVEEAKLRLDEPVDRLLPELADRQVLRGLDRPLDDTVPANRPITLRDLLTFRLGLGAVMAPPGRYPIQKAVAEAGLAPGPNPSPLSPNEFMVRVGGLPLMHQPGEKWMYHTGSDILGVLIARAAGTSLGDVLQERVFAPLGMKDTAFSVPETKLARLATCYQIDAGAGRLAVLRRSARRAVGPSVRLSVRRRRTGLDGRRLPRLRPDDAESGPARRGPHPGAPDRRAHDRRPSDARAEGGLAFYPGFWDNRGWGFGVSVTTRRDGVAASPGSFGWDGGFGTSWCTDPHEDMVAILLIQRLMTSPTSGDINSDFWTLAYQALDD
jgi:CubicO group peptidase (beta-lactamase class C family)